MDAATTASFKLAHEGLPLHTVLGITRRIISVKQIKEQIVENLNENNFPYQVIDCEHCGRLTMGDAENWPPNVNMYGCYECMTYYCGDCEDIAKKELVECKECRSWYCDECYQPHFESGYH